MKEFDLIVIGAGPGGYVAAIRAAQLGLKVACVDKSDRLGGTCLRVGCIPSKALLESSELFVQANESFKEHGIEAQEVRLDLPKMLKRKDRVVEALTKGVAGLFRQREIEHVQGTGRLAENRRVLVEAENGKETELKAKHILIATGSKAAMLKGVQPDGNLIGTSTEALSYEKVPNHLVVIGAGYIGLEMGAVWNRLGAKVTVLEYLDRILPGTDAEIAKEAHKIFRKQGLEFRLGSRVTSVTAKKQKCRVECEDAEPIACDRVLVATGRSPNTEGLNLESIGLETDDKGFIPVDEDFQTSVKGVFAIGDVIGGPLLAHKAEDEGVACVEGIVNGYGHVNYQAIPSVIYTHPEIAAVGKTEEQLQEENVDYKTGRFPYRANGRARALGQTEGFVKILADSETDRILGVHILGARAGDLIAEAAVAIEFSASSEDIARSSHAHPTLAEVLKEGALDVLGRALHT